MKKILSYASVWLAALAIPALAQQAPDHAAQYTPVGGQSQKDAPLTAGEVRKVDKEAKKLTIRHGALENLGMPPMTMVFQVADPAMLDRVKAGDKVRFSAENPGGTFVVTQLEQAD